MNRFACVVSALLAIGILSACGVSEKVASDGGTDMSTECTGELAAYCAAATCRTYENEVSYQRMRALAPQCFLSRIGTCGAYRFVEYSVAALDNTVLYYSADGTLIAATSASDTNEYCGKTAFTIHYGPAIDCTRVETELLCLCLPGQQDAGSC